MRRALLLSLVVSGCGAGSPARVQTPNDPTPLTKCRVAASAENPLVTEWSAPEKANLEARLRQGAVAVEYSGCEMRLLPDCHVRGNYTWRRTTTTTDVVEIHDADELYTKLPLGAVALEGALEQTGRLAVETSVSGQLELRNYDLAGFLPYGPCARATHVVGALAVGAFTLRSGGSTRASGGAGVTGVGSAGVARQGSESVMRSAGDRQACSQASEQAPHPECGSPIQVFLLPVQKADVGAPGTVKVSFLSASGDDWEVMVGDRVLCKTPCKRWVDPAIPYGMRHEESFFERDQQATVPDLREHGSGPLEVRAEPRSNAGLLGGLTLTTFGGLGVATGITLTAVGCSSEDRSGLCTAGLITLPVSLAVLAPGIWLIVTSGERAEVTQAGVQPPLLGLGGEL